MIEQSTRTASGAETEVWKADLVFPPGLVEAIADRVIEKLRPHLASSCGGNCHGTEEDTLLDVEGLSSYLRVSKNWIYERTHLREIPHIKKGKKILLFRKSDIDSWLDRDRIPVIQTPPRILKALKQ